MQSISEPPTRTPISTVPYDVLSEIFRHCLPQYPLKEQQPNTKIAPMLLCHICSSWRTISLASPTLWTHLSFCLTLVGNQNLRDMPTAFAESEIDFIRWWRKNQGSMAPFLNLSVKHNTREISQQAEEDMEGIMGFFTDYMMSAEYLRLDRFFWARLRERCSLVKFGSFEAGIYYEIDALKSPDAFPALRRLSITGGILRSKHSNSIPLTHVSLDRISLPISFWLSFIRALPNLQCGYFNIKDLDDHERYTEPPTCTLFQLSTLCVALRHSRDYSSSFSFTTLFRNLHLPSVRTLSLLWPTHNGRYGLESDNMGALYTALKSAPAVTTLVLAECFLALVTPNSPQVGPIEPIWNHIPHLLELQLEVPQGGSYPLFEQSKKEVEAELNVFVQDVMFAEGNWLDLRNPACPVRAVTIVDKVSPPGNDFAGEFTMTRIRRHADQFPNIVFQLASKSAAHLAVDALHD